MNGWHDTTQLILQILRDPVWSDIGGICLLIGIPLAILLARKPETTLLKRE